MHLAEGLGNSPWPHAAQASQEVIGSDCVHSVLQIIFHKRLTQTLTSNPSGGVSEPTCPHSKNAAKTTTSPASESRNYVFDI